MATDHGRRDDACLVWWLLPSVVGGVGRCFLVGVEFVGLWAATDVRGLRGVGQLLVFGARGRRGEALRFELVFIERRRFGYVLIFGVVEKGWGFPSVTDPSQPFSKKTRIPVGGGGSAGGVVVGGLVFAESGIADGGADAINDFRGFVVPIFPQ